MTEELWRLSARALAKKIAAREVSSAEAVEQHLARIDSLDTDVRAFITVTPELARPQAAEVDAKIANGEKLGPLAGVPLALKDILTVDGVRTTAGSKILENYHPPYDATVTKRLRAAGTPIVGKANMDEFAMGSSTENSAYGASHNPWDLARIPGGSSGGSAAAVAAGFAPIGIGTDTGGSIRQPASVCGIVGVKPTYGLVSRYGLLAFASSLDQVGPFARTVEDAAALLQVVAGHDPMDSTSINAPVPDYAREIDGGVKGLRVGVVTDWLETDGLQPGVASSVRAAVDVLAGLGAQIGEISLPSFRYALSAYYLIAPAECSSNLARYDGVRFGHRTSANVKDIVEMNVRTRTEGFGDEVKRRIMLGTYALSAGYYDAYYGKAQQVRTLVIRDFAKAYEQFDVLVGPTSPTTAFKLGEKTDDPLAMYLNDVFTIPTNLAGAAAISLPSGLAEEDQLPVGLQILGPPLSESLLFKVAHAYEQARGPIADPPLWSAK